jgi:hypothetical protein
VSAKYSGIVGKAQWHSNNPNLEIKAIQGHGVDLLVYCTSASLCRHGRESPLATLKSSTHISSCLELGEKDSGTAFRTDDMEKLDVEV